MDITHRAKLVDQSVLSPSTRWFRFESVSAELPFEPGQFYRLTMQDSRGTFERSFSFSQTDLLLPKNQFELVVSAVAGGRATNWLFNADLGAEVTLQGPYGRLLLPEPPAQKLLLIATSVGLAPFLPMLARLQAQSPEHPRLVHLRLGVRSPDEFLYEAYLTALHQQYSWFDLSLFYSRQMPEQPDPWAYSGYVTEGLSAETLDAATDRVLVCGNPKMVDDVYQILRSKGFGPKTVVREKYVFAAQERTAKSKASSAADAALLQEKIKQYTTKQRD
ncbi:MAG: FAD-dependent oxidoreductase [Proteobacteria bacterium]|nr:FAD-dependent oxidoreductase [Pseudomonadota bacterium]MDA0956645.1 FAD-dependent oxidoreductase [Pseudomonadota bacterium]